MIRSVVHLVDDATCGGVNRMLEHMVRPGEPGRSDVHRVVVLRRGQLSPPALDADVVVSHLGVCWKNLPLTTALRAANPKTPMVHVEHSYSERFHALHVTDPDRFAALLRTTYSLFDRIVAVSRPQGAWMLRRGFCTEAQLTVVNPTVTLDRFFAVPDRRPGPTLAIGAIGRLDPQKGFDILIEAFRMADVAAATLHVVGDGPQRAELLRRAAGSPNIRFHGFTADVPAAMALCDVVAVPSRWEPFGLVAQEAMAVGRPVLCSTADGLATHVAAGAVAVGDGSQFGWAEMLARLPGLDLAPLAVAGRRHAGTAAARFAAGWRDLIEGLFARTETVRAVA